MPFIGLVLTSSAFLLPVWVAKRCKKRQFAMACKVLTGTSLLFHSNILLPFSAVLDKAYVHAFAVIYATKSAMHAVWRRSLFHAVMTSTMAVPICVYCEKVRKTEGLESKLWHMLFHISGQSCLVLYAIFF